MFGFSAKLPINDEERLWIDQGFYRLEKYLGRKRMLEARVILPTANDFPDPYDRSPAAAENLFARVAGYMQVDRRKLTSKSLLMRPRSCEGFFRTGKEVRTAALVSTLMRQVPPMNALRNRCW